MEKLYFIGTNGYNAIVYVNTEENISKIFWNVDNFTYDATEEEKETEAMQQIETVEDVSSWGEYADGIMFNPDEFLDEHFENVIYAEMTVKNLL